MRAPGPARPDYDSPGTAPATTLAADGVTPLTRFRVSGVIYARSRAEAQARLGSAGVYLDRAALVDEEG